MQSQQHSSSVVANVTDKIREFIMLNGSTCINIGCSVKNIRYSMLEMLCAVFGHLLA